MASHFAIGLTIFLVAVTFTQASTPQLLAITCESLETMSDFQLDSVSVNGTKNKIGNLTHVGTYFFSFYKVTYHSYLSRWNCSNDSGVYA